MTRRAEKQQQKKAQLQEMEKQQQLKLNKRKIILQILKFLSIFCCIAFFVAVLFSSGKARLQYILGILWSWTIAAFLNWKINPDGFSACTCQAGKSGLFQIVYRKNVAVFIVSLILSVIMSLIIIPL